MLRFTLGFVVAAFAFASTASAQTVRQVLLAGVSSVSGSTSETPNTGALQGPEFDSAVIGGDTDGGDADGAPIAINRSVSQGPGSPASQDRKSVV